MTKPTGGGVGRPISESVAQQYHNSAPVNTFPKKPVGLQAAGKKAWDDVWGSGRVNEEEAVLIAEYCFLVDDVANTRRAVKALDASFYRLGDRGAYAPHPLVAELKEKRQMMLAFQRELIMSPASRVKANLEIEKQSDKTLADFVTRAEAREAANRMMNEEQ